MNSLSSEAVDLALKGLGGLTLLLLMVAAVIVVGTAIWYSPSDPNEKE